MKLSILVVLAALIILISGFQNPAFFFIGYIWTSVLYPTAFVTTVFPLSMIFGFCCLVGYFFIDKTNQGRLPLVFFLTILFAVWVTFTTMRAQQPEDAWSKWHYAIQSIIITIATPLLLRTRAQMETAFIATLTAIAAHVMTGGIKTILGTGGYDRLGRLMMSNFWLGETSTLALAAVISIPMAYYAIKHSIVFEPYRGRLLHIIFGFYTMLAIMCVIGTSARTGVITLGALLVFGIRGIVRRALVILGAIGLFYVAQPYLPGKSLGRFGTINTYQQDDSAVIRLAVWKWSIQYASEHPLGGGFSIFYTNSFPYQVQNAEGQTITRQSRGTAPHSTYFEVLGEHGYPGAFLYLFMIASGLWGTWRISRLPQDKSGQPWPAAFGRALVVCTMLYCVGASFVGIAFQPLLYLFLGFYCSVFRWIQSQRVPRAKFSAEPESHAALV